ncbi:MAG: hypothetical protein U1A78_34805 [Polyangia bacterium]
MSLTPHDFFQAGQLVGWGLRVSKRPALEPGYRELLRRYLEEPLFREAVRELAQGLGLTVLDASEHGVALGPTEGSAFALRPSEFRKVERAEDRLLDGLVQLGIAVAVFPRARDLEEETTLARPPLVVQDVEDLLRSLCARLHESTKGQPDPTASDEEQGLVEAWRIFKRRQPTADTKDGRRAPGTTLRIIEENLERLCDLGCFVRSQRGESVSYQATWRYQVLVRELAASAAYEQVRRALNDPIPEAEA